MIPHIKEGPEKFYFFVCFGDIAKKKKKVLVKHILSNSLFLNK